MALGPLDWVPLAEVARPHGVRGELRLRLYNPDSDLLLGADEVLVRLKDGDEHEVSVDRARRADDAILMKLHSVDDRDRADELRSAVIMMRRRDFPPVEAGEFYFCDVVGARALVRHEPTSTDDSAEREWGTIEGFRTYPTAQAFVVRITGREPVEVPIVDAFIERLDIEQGIVVFKDVEMFESDELQPKKPKTTEPRAPSPRALKRKALREAKRKEPTS